MPGCILHLTATPAYPHLPNWSFSENQCVEKPQIGALRPSFLPSICHGFSQHFAGACNRPGGCLDKGKHTQIRNMATCPWEIQWGAMKTRSTNWSLSILYCYCCSVAQLSLILCNPIDCSIPGFPVLHHLSQLAQTYGHWVSDAIQPFCSLSSPSTPVFHLSHHQGLFQWFIVSNKVAKVLELQHQSGQWIFRIDFL